MISKLKNRKIAGIVALFALFAFMATPEARAQNDVLLTQQWLSRINQNPSATGNSNNIDIFVLARRQWAGFENAPETGVVNIHSYFHRIRSGLGLTATYDKLGVANQSINAKLAYAYHVNLGEKWLLSLGLSGGILQQSYNPQKHFVLDEIDDSFLMDKTSELSPDVDFGIELNSRRFQFGASATHLMTMPNKQTSLKRGQQYHAYASYKQPLGSSFELVLGGRGTNFDTDLFYDINLTGILLKNYWLGVAFRPNNAVAGMIGLQIAFLRLGYSYDYGLGPVRNLSQTSHEIMVSLKIAQPKKVVRTKSPRFIDE
jgi:type IX secretion system PorP/SprF family membrane protein